MKQPQLSEHFSKYLRRKVTMNYEEVLPLSQLSRKVATHMYRRKKLTLWEVLQFNNTKNYPRGSFFVIYDKQLFFYDSITFAILVEKSGLMWCLTNEMQCLLLDRARDNFKKVWTLQV